MDLIALNRYTQNETKNKQVLKRKWFVKSGAMA